jgi:acid phosphatase (class A)
LPATKKMLQDITATEDTVSKGAKKFFHRPRPWIVIADWKTCSPHKDGPALNSYPSGHATLTYAMGVVLSSLVPDKSQAILAASSRFAESRMVCGVHFRIDLAAGQALGTVLGNDLLNSPAFQADYTAAADELIKAGIRQAK